jgi:hypothetical protein
MYFLSGEPMHYLSGVDRHRPVELADQSGQRWILARDGLSAFDPGCVKTSTSAARVEVFLRNCAI